MSFNYHARKVRNADLDIWIRWSNLHSCLSSVVRPGSFQFWRRGLFGAWEISPENPPTHRQLTEALDRLTVQRNRRLDALRAYERRRIREKMRGKRKP